MSEISTIVDKNAIAQINDLDLGITGKEDIEAGDMAKPVIFLMQAMTPVDNNIPGAARNSATGDTYDITKEPLEVIPIAFKKSFLEYSRSEDRLLDKVGTHNKYSEIVQSADTIQEGRFAGKLIARNGNILVETATHIVFLPESNQVAFIPFKNTNLKVSKGWVTMIQSSPVKYMFGSTYHISSEKVSRDNNSWYQYKVTKGDLIMDAIKLRELADLAKQANDFKAEDFEPQEPKATVEVDEQLVEEAM